MLKTLALAALAASFYTAQAELFGAAEEAVTAHQAQQAAAVAEIQGYQARARGVTAARPAYTAHSSPADTRAAAQAVQIRADQAQAWAEAQRRALLAAGQGGA